MLLALSLAATCFPLPGVTEMSVTCADKVLTVRAERFYPAGTFMLLPLVPGHQQVVTESRHPHSVPVSADSRTLYLVPSWKSTWHSPFWAAQRSYAAAECNSALVELQDYVVHYFAGVGVVAGFEFNHALTEAAKVPCLINSAELQAGTDCAALGDGAFRASEAAGSKSTKGFPDAAAT